MIYGVAVFTTVTLSYFSRARGLFILALLIAAMWIATIIVYKFEVALGRSLFYISPIIEAPIIAYMFLKGSRRDYTGAAVYNTVAWMLVAQWLIYALLSFAVTSPWWLHMVGNRIFELILLFMSGIAIGRLVRIHNPALFEKITDRWNEGSATKRAVTPTSITMGHSTFERRVINLLIDIRNSDKPESERQDKIAPSDVELARKAKRKGMKPVKRD